MRTTLRREIVFSLLLKVMALLALWAAFFSPVHRPSTDAGTMGEVVFAPAPHAPVGTAQ